MQFSDASGVFETAMMSVSNTFPGATVPAVELDLRCKAHSQSRRSAFFFAVG